MSGRNSTISGANVAQKDMLMCHFRLNSNFAARVKNETSKRHKSKYKTKYYAYREMLRDRNNVIFDADVSVPWTQNAIVRAVLGAG